MVRGKAPANANHQRLVISLVIKHVKRLKIERLTRENMVHTFYKDAGSLSHSIFINQLPIIAG